MMGGIQSIVSQDDIVIVKPNAQWEGHAITNTDTLKGLIDLILEQGNFGGEIIIAENHHFHPDDSRGWTAIKRNGRFNLNELIEYYRANGHKNVTKCHWRDAGKCRYPIHGDARAGRLLESPEEGDGYIWGSDDYSYKHLKTKMNYPVFTSSYSGKRIDFKHGILENGKFIPQCVKFINISALNHHGNTGITASIKNYMGVVDMTCGFHGEEPEGYYNFHYVGFDWPNISIVRRALQGAMRSQTLRRMKQINRLITFIGPVNGATGGAIGRFMKKVRVADVHIVAAEYVGHESRWKNPIQVRKVIASFDPVALDYYGAKYIMLPLGGIHAHKHDPDDPKTSLRRFLDLCCREGIGTLDERRMVIHQHDFNTDRQETYHLAS
jgi:hypothetical protein